MWPRAKPRPRKHAGEEPAAQTDAAAKEVATMTSENTTSDGGDGSGGGNGGGKRRGRGAHDDGDEGEADGHRTNTTGRGGNYLDAAAGRWLI